MRPTHSARSLGAARTLVAQKTTRMQCRRDSCTTGWRGRCRRRPPCVTLRPGARWRVWRSCSAVTRWRAVSPAHSRPRCGRRVCSTGRWSPGARRGAAWRARTRRWKRHCARCTPPRPRPHAPLHLAFHHEAHRRSCPPPVCRTSDRRDCKSLLAWKRRSVPSPLPAQAWWRRQSPRADPRPSCRPRAPPRGHCAARRRPPSSALATPSLLSARWCGSCTRSRLRRASCATWTLSRRWRRWSAVRWLRCDQG
mmetsp:Transcript_20232/g.64576  ORF Transcript_20232/g.64576 Transcript_20232/m.64576 type:complete len:252 (+) Transcript_20232:759-1514(+)